MSAKREVHVIGGPYHGTIVKVPEKDGRVVFVEPEEPGEEYRQDRGLNPIGVAPRQVSCPIREMAGTTWGSRRWIVRWSERQS